MGTPAFNDAADKIRREEAAADKAREAADAEKARADLAARFPNRYQTPKTLDEAQAMDDPKGARMDAFHQTVGDPSGRTPAQADELAMIRASPDYTGAHRNYLERARKGENLFGVSGPGGRITSGEGTLWSPHLTAEQYRNNMDAPYGNSDISEELKQMPVSQRDAGGFGPTQSAYSANMVDNLARLEAIEAYQQERARAKRQSEK